MRVIDEDNTFDNVYVETNTFYKIYSRGDSVE